jgi:hypothetical protein
MLFRREAMSVRQRQNVAYGLSQPLIPEAPAPIAAHRSPTTTDYAAIGTVWSNTLTSQVYILASIIANVATWILVTAGGGAGAFASLTVTPGPISLTGTTTINTAGAAATSIGNAASTTTILGPTNINQTGAATTNINAAGTGAVNIGNATGNVTIPAGNLVLTNGDISLNPAANIEWRGLSGIFAGTGDPNGIVFAPQGSLYLRDDGSGVNNRAYINTDGVSTWTAIVTVA